ncbi:MAG: hypothetical protein EOP67_42035, partial [Sphingomonas sp.]
MLLLVVWLLVVQIAVLVIQLIIPLTAPTAAKMYNGYILQVAAFNVAQGLQLFLYTIYACITLRRTS